MQFSFFPVCHHHEFLVIVLSCTVSTVHIRWKRKKMKWHTSAIHTAKSPSIANCVFHGLCKRLIIFSSYRVVLMYTWPHLRRPECFQFVDISFLCIHIWFETTPRRPHSQSTSGCCHWLKIPWSDISLSSNSPLEESGRKTRKEKEETGAGEGHLVVKGDCWENTIIVAINLPLPHPVLWFNVWARYQIYATVKWRNFLHVRIS